MSNYNRLAQELRNLQNGNELDSNTGTEFLVNNIDEIINGLLLAGQTNGESAIKLPAKVKARRIPAPKKKPTPRNAYRLQAGDKAERYFAYGKKWIPCVVVEGGAIRDVDSPRPQYEEPSNIRPWSGQPWTPVPDIKVGDKIWHELAWREVKGRIIHNNNVYLIVHVAESWFDRLELQTQRTDRELPTNEQ